jgi:hypothetical protein
LNGPPLTRGGPFPIPEATRKIGPAATARGHNFPEVVPSITGRAQPVNNGAGPAGSWRPATMCHVRIPKRRRWLLAATLAWAVLIAGLAVYAVRRGQSTIRAETSVAAALPTVDRVIAEVATAAATAGAVVQIGGYERAGSSCSITAVRDGARYERSVSLFVAAGQEGALMDQVGAHLPERYAVEVRKSGNHSLTADAGNYVAVRGSAVGAGQARVTADTGCRPLTRPVTEAQPPSDGANREPVEAVLNALKVSDATFQTHRVSCDRGGSVWTVQADGPPGSAPASLVDALHETSPVLARPDVYAYRSGPVGVVARTRDGVLTVTATTGCGAQ